MYLNIWISKSGTHTCHYNSPESPGFMRILSRTLTKLSISGILMLFSSIVDIQALTRLSYIRKNIV